MRPRTELEEAMRAVQYEFNHLVGAAMLLSGHFLVQVGPGPAAATPPSPELVQDFCTILHNNVVEAFLIHARTLIDFFIGPSNYRNTDIVAWDFFDSPDAWRRGLQRDNLHRDRERIGRKLAHLTYGRLTDRDGWNPRDLVDRLATLRDRFNGLGPAYLIATNVMTLVDPPIAGPR
jgi:hypothetical protein